MSNKYFKDFITTLGFMTRLAPPRMVRPEELAATLPWMPLTGAIMGALIVFPFALGLLSGNPDIQAWLTVAASIYLTRGLHFDGISDITDGAGPYPAPDRFWRILKDSRCGVFGVIALVLSIAGQILLFSKIYAAEAFGTIIWIFIVGRMGNVAMSLAGRRFTRPGQGALFMAGADRTSFSLVLGVTFAAGLLLTGLEVQLLTYSLCAMSIFFLYRLARKVRGANGDFLGAALVLCELSAALSFCILNQ